MGHNGGTCDAGKKNMKSTAAISQSEAISVALQIAREHGLRIDHPIPLRSTNNAVAWLAPTEIVAKVGVGLHSRLHKELRVATELAGIGAPIVPPATELPAVVHSRQGLEVTFWRYHPQSPQTDDCPAEHIAPALRHFHTALRHLSPALKSTIPSFEGKLAHVRALLTQPESLPALAARDRRLLARTFERLEAQLNDLVSAEDSTLIHGEPHAYNVLFVSGEPRFIDLETVCTGPIEWDLACLDEPAEDAYGASIRPRLLWVCRGMASVCTAALCWADVERGDLREHAEWHLSHVKTRIAPFV